MPANHGIAITVAPQQVLRRRRVVPRLAALLAVVALGSPDAAAQGLNLGAGSTDNRPIDITADSGLEWQQQAQVYIARGNAVATRGTSEVHADTLTAHYRPSKSKTADGGNEVYRLDADGHVILKGPTQTVIGDQAVYDLDQQIAVVTGKALKLTTPTDVVTARDSLEWYDETQIAVARGGAVASRADKHIRADVLTAHMTKEKPNPAGDKPGAINPAEIKSTATPAKPQSGPKQASPSGPLGTDSENSRISRVDAQGNVVAWNSTDIGRGDYGVYNADTGIVTLLGNVTITRGQNVIRGKYAVLDLNTNVSRMMTVAAKPGEPAPRVEGLFFRQDATTAASGGGPATGAKPASSGRSKP
jgi:lipopolysaccharide export system protein LptA